MSTDAAMAAMEDHAEALGALNRVTRERDHAREVAVRLEEEIAYLREVGCSPEPRVAHRPDPTPWPHPDAEVS